MIKASHQRFSLFYSSPARHSGGSAKPGWHVGKAQRWGPEIPDKQYFWDHPTYTGFVLWLRGVRPYIEKLAGDAFKTGKHVVVNRTYNPIRNFVVHHNPDIRTDLKHLRTLDQGVALQNEGFFMSESEDLDQRIQNYSSDHYRLNGLWDAAISEASEIPDAEEGFQKLCSLLEIKDVESHPSQVPAPITWRFNMIPYGAGNENATTFPASSQEQPHRSFALNFTYNNLAYDWGDYVDRRDNKGAPVRPSRLMFTDVYIPPTK